MKGRPLDADEGVMDPEVRIAVEEGTEREEDMSIPTDIEISKDGMSILQGLH